VKGRKLAIGLINSEDITTVEELLKYLREQPRKIEK
jgi:hypothetical protein